MSFNNKTEKRTYSINDRPSVKNCGGQLDQDGIDSYWGESRTIRSDADNADIQLIMNKYAKTGIIQANIRQNPQYLDNVSIPDFQTAQNLIAKANEKFYSLDAKIRARFQNDPAKLIEFINNDSNYDEAVKLKLVKPKESNTIDSKASTPPIDSKESKKD